MQTLHSKEIVKGNIFYKSMIRKMLRVKTISIRVGKNHNEPANIVRAAQRGNPQLSSSAVISTHSSFQNDKEPKETTIRGRYEKFQIIQL